MYCKNCGSVMDENAAVCTKCGYTRGTGSKFCQHCGQPMTEGQAVCTKCGYALDSNGSNTTSSFEFTRISKGKIIGGVCTGLGKKWNVSPWIIRAGFVFLPLWPVWVIIYIVLMNKYPIQ